MKLLIPTFLLAIYGLGGGLSSKAEEPLLNMPEMLDAGTSVVGADLFQQGEFLKGPLKQTRKVGNNREYAGYSFGYNHTLFAHRTHDVMTLVSWVAGFDEEKPEEVALAARDGMVPVALAALSQVGGVKNAMIDDLTFRFANLKSYRDPDFLPGAVKYGDLPALLKISHARIVK